MCVVVFCFSLWGKQNTFSFDFAHPKAPNLEFAFRHLPQSKTVYMGAHLVNPILGICGFDVNLREDGSLAKKTLNWTCAVCWEWRLKQGLPWMAGLEPAAPVLACPFHLRMVCHPKIQAPYGMDTDVCTDTRVYVHVMTSLDLVARCPHFGLCNIIPPCNSKL